MRILLVEDEKYIAKPIEQMLKKNHYNVDVAYDGEFGLDCALTGVYDIIVLDIMMPKMDGITVLRKLRDAGIKAPVLMLTAKDRPQDKIHGLDSGADDYLSKPFDINELLARLRALGRRQGELSPDGILKFGDIALNPHALTLRCDEKESQLTKKESQLLEMFIQNRNRIVSKNMIIEKLWGYDTDAEDSNVEYHVSFLRKRLADVEAGVSIRTVRGVGYMLEVSSGS